MYRFATMKTTLRLLDKIWKDLPPGAAQASKYILFLSLILIFSIKITIVSVQKPNTSIYKKNAKFLPIRRDILDRNSL